ARTPPYTQARSAARRQGARARDRAAKRKYTRRPRASPVARWMSMLACRAGRGERKAPHRPRHRVSGTCLAANSPGKVCSRMRILWILGAALIAACTAPSSPAAQEPGAPVAQGAPNTEYQPAFAGQTRAPAQNTNVTIANEVIAS